MIAAFTFAALLALPVMTRTETTFAAKIIRISVYTSVNTRTHTVSITFSNLVSVKNVYYEFTYSHNGIPEGVLGNLGRTSKRITKNILLGSCSTGGVCIYHKNVISMKLKVVTTYSNGATVTTTYKVK